MTLAIIHLYGNLGRDAELRYTQSGNPVLHFTMACSSVQGTGEQRREHTDWFNVSLFGKRGEAIAQYLLKGTRVAVVGRFQHRTFTRQDGTVGCALDVIASEIDFAGGGRPVAEAGDLDETTPTPARADEPTRSRPRPARPVEEVLADDDDVPF
jgi:single-strand DNA-binding protein